MIGHMASKPVDEQRSALPNFAKPRLELQFGIGVPTENRFELFVVQRKHLLHDCLDLIHEGVTLRTSFLCGGRLLLRHDHIILLWARKSSKRRPRANRKRRWKERIGPGYLAIW